MDLVDVVGTQPYTGGEPRSLLERRRTSATPWSSEMQPSDWIQIIATILVFLALILNILQLRQVAHQSGALLRSSEQRAYGSLVNKNLEIRTTYFLDDPELLA